MPHKSQLINHNMFESLEKLTAAVEAACADIAPSYAEYVQLAMAIATDCGEGAAGTSTASAASRPSTSRRMPTVSTPTP